MIGLLASISLKHIFAETDLYVRETILFCSVFLFYPLDSFVHIQILDEERCIVCNIPIEDTS